MPWIPRKYARDPVPPTWSRPWSALTLRPLCLCGCDEPVGIASGRRKFADPIRAHRARFWANVRAVLAGHKVAEECIPAYAVYWVNWLLFLKGITRRVTRVDVPLMSDAHYARRSWRAGRGKRRRERERIRAIRRDYKASLPVIPGWSMRRMVRGW